MSKCVLVCGATGTIGRSVISGLSTHKHINVRALVRGSAHEQMFDDVNMDVIQGSFEEPDRLATAMHEVDTLILITPFSEEAAVFASSAISAAKKSGVRKIIRVSALQAGENAPTENGRLHGITDLEIVGSGLDYTILRPNFFMQNMLLSLPGIMSTQNFFMGMSDGKMGMIDARDIADSIVRIALDGTFNREILEITGPDQYTFFDVAAVLSDLMGQVVTYIPVSPDDVYEGIVSAGFGVWAAGVFRDYARAYSDNWGAYTTDNVELIVKRPARSFETFARDILLASPSFEA